MGLLGKYIAMKSVSVLKKILSILHFPDVRLSHCYHSVGVFGFPVDKISD